MYTKKKILFLIPTLMNGGAERVLVNLVNNLDFDEYDVSLKTVMNVGRYQDKLDKRIHYSYIFNGLHHWTRFYFLLFSPEYTFKKFIGEEYDIVVSYLEGITSRIISGCNNPKIKKVAWIHIELNDNKMFSKGFRSVSEAKKCYASFDNIVCVSRTVKEIFDKRLGLPQKTQVLYNTNDTDDILRRKEEPVDDFNPNKDEINIVSVAKITRTKGYDRLAEVQKRLRSEGIKTHVYLIGTGDMEEQLVRYANVNGISDSFTLLGYKENPYKYMALCDLYVCSSRREGFSTAVTEALMCDLPVVSTNCSGANELLGDKNEYGIVVNNDTSSLYLGIKEMIEGENLSVYKQRSILRKNDFSKKNTISKTTQLFHIKTVC